MTEKGFVELSSSLYNVFSFPRSFFRLVAPFKSCAFHSEVVRELARFKTMTTLDLWDVFYSSSYKSVYYFLKSVQGRFGLSDCVVEGSAFLEVVGK